MRGLRDPFPWGPNVPWSTHDVRDVFIYPDIPFLSMDIWRCIFLLLLNMKAVSPEAWAPSFLLLPWTCFWNPLWSAPAKALTRMKHVGGAGLFYLVPAITTQGHTLAPRPGARGNFLPMIISFIHLPLCSRLLFPPLSVSPSRSSSRCFPCSFVKKCFFICFCVIEEGDAGESVREGIQAQLVCRSPHNEQTWQDESVSRLPCADAPGDPLSEDNLKMFMLICNWWWTWM